MCTGRKRSTCGSKRAHAGGARLEAFEAQQRVEPDDLVRHAPQAARRRFARSPCSSRSSPSVISSSAAFAPSRRRAQRWLNSCQARRDARAAVPVLHLLVGVLQRDVGVAKPQAARDVGQPRAEGQRVHLEVAPRQAVHVVQQQPRIAVHRAGDVEQHDERRHLGARPREGRRQRVRLARHAQHRRAQVELAARGAVSMAAPAHRLAPAAAPLRRGSWPARTRPRSSSRSRPAAIARGPRR